MFARYQLEHHCKSPSDVIKKALALKQIQLEADYREANQEIDDAFEITVADGLDENETWCIEKMDKEMSSHEKFIADVAEARGIEHGIEMGIKQVAKKRNSQEIRYRKLLI